MPEATARRLTERAGAAYVAVQTAAVERVEQDAPAPARGPAVQPVGVDGAMVPLRQREWAEVKTLAVGTVRVGTDRDGEPVVRAEELSSFSRLAEIDAFTRLARVETERRGTETAGAVAGVVDGAPWCQGFLDAHRPDAVRILDFPHVAKHLNLAAQAVFGAGTGPAHEWLRTHARLLKAEGAAPVLAALRELPVAGAPDPAAAERTRDEVLGYLEKRVDQLRYPAFVARGLPIGSGAGERANKVAVEARLRGAGVR